MDGFLREQSFAHNTFYNDKNTYFRHTKFNFHNIPVIAIGNINFNLQSAQNIYKYKIHQMHRTGCKPCTWDIS